MSFAINLLSVAAFLALVAATIHTIKRNLICVPAERVSFVAYGVFDVVGILLWIACALCIVTALPHPSTVLFVSMILVSSVIASSLRYHEEVRSLNRWMQMATGMRTALPELLDRFASGCRSRLAVRAKGCVRRLRLGETVVDAVRRSKLEMDIDTLATLSIPGPCDVGTGNASSYYPQYGHGVDAEEDYESSRSRSLHVQQFTYIVATLLLARLISLMVQMVVVPIVEDFFEDGDFGGYLWVDTLNGFVLIADCVIIAMAIWLSAAFLIRWVPWGWVAYVPWFGNSAIAKWRSGMLDSLQRGMRVRQPEKQLLQFLAHSTRIGWVRQRCRLIHHQIELGTPLPAALRQGNVITDREQVWLNSALGNGTLPDAIEMLCGDIQRQQDNRWKIRMAWFVPLATVLIAVYVAANFMFLFHYLMSTIQALAS